MVIDKPSRVVLDALIAGTPDFPMEIYSIPAAVDAIPLDEAEALRVIRTLLDLKLLEKATDQRGNEIGVALTQRGVCYREIRALEAKERWKERGIGFVLGVLTAVVAGAILSFLHI